MDLNLKYPEVPTNFPWANMEKLADSNMAIKHLSRRISILYSVNLKVGIKLIKDKKYPDTEIYIFYGTYFSLIFNSNILRRFIKDKGFLSKKFEAFVNIQGKFVGKL